MTTATQTVIPTGSWKADPVHSSVSFLVKHLLATFRGGFAEYDVTIHNEDGTPRFEGTVPVNSLEVRDEMLNGHLLSPEFFDAERHPEIRFVSNAVRVDGDELVVDGELTIKGVTKNVEARGTIAGPVEHPAGGERLAITLETAVDRNEYGLEWNAPLPSGDKMLGDEVTLSVSLELAKEEA
jgi:polyisoprenoid-binding protein YceI